METKMILRPGALVQLKPSEYYNEYAAVFYPATETSFADILVDRQSVGVYVFDVSPDDEYPCYYGNNKEVVCLFGERLVQIEQAVLIQLI